MHAKDLGTPLVILLCLSDFPLSLLEQCYSVMIRYRDDGAIRDSAGNLGHSLRNQHCFSDEGSLNLTAMVRNVDYQEIA